MTQYQQAVLWFWSGLMSGIALCQILTTIVSMWSAKRSRKEAEKEKKTA